MIAPAKQSAKIFQCIWLQKEMFSGYKAILQIHVLKNVKF